MTIAARDRLISITKERLDRVDRPALVTLVKTDDGGLRIVAINREGGKPRRR